jgi:hypothetical protein
MAAPDWCAEWRDHALPRLIRRLLERTHRRQSTRELADALEWSTCGVRCEPLHVWRAMVRSWEMNAMGQGLVGDQGGTCEGFSSLE